jgi:ATP-dependent Clp protease protease subunit
MRRTADLLESVSGTMIDTYAARTGNSRDQVKAWMDEETWMTAQEACDRKFANSVTEPVRVAACVRRPESFRHLPSALRPNRNAAQATAARIAALVK